MKAYKSMFRAATFDVVRMAARDLSGFLMGAIFKLQRVESACELGLKREINAAHDVPEDADVDPPRGDGGDGLGGMLN